MGKYTEHLVSGVSLNVIPYDNSNDQYDEFRQAIKDTFDKTTRENKALFKTNATGLYDVFLANLPAEARQHYTCRECKNFVERYGHLAVVKEKGTLMSALWDDKVVPVFFKSAVKAMKEAVQKADNEGQFLSEDNTLGRGFLGGWYHFTVNLPDYAIFTSDISDAEQEMAKKKENARILTTGLELYPKSSVEQALLILKSEQLNRSELYTGVANFLLNLHTARDSVRNHKQKANLVWLAVATAPDGFCHIKESTIGELLSDISDGMPFETVKRRFEYKVNPLTRQRAQVAPTQGNINRAEQIVAKMGLEPSFPRRYARKDELKVEWIPKDIEQAPNKGGVFGHIKAKDASPKQEIESMQTPFIPMTWEKFARTVLPSALSIEYRVESGLGNYGAIVTAVNPDAKPIFQWDREEQRNPFSWYLYPRGSYAESWNLSTGFVKVTAITNQPSMWYGGFEHQGKSVFLILEGAKDKRYHDLDMRSLALFPDCLRSELREVRATIEAFSNEGKIQGYEESTACGVRLSAGKDWNAVVRVKTSLGTSLYKLDRWD